LRWKTGAGRAGGAQYIRRPGVTKISRAKINIDVDGDWRHDDVLPILRGAIKCRDGRSVLLQLLRGAQNDDEVRRRGRLGTDRFVEFQVIDLAEAQMVQVFTLARPDFIRRRFAAAYLALFIAINRKFTAR